jgi:tape measure domain-containing protein
MADVTKGTNFFIVPTIDRQSATKAEADIQKLVQQGAAAVAAGNDKLLAQLDAKMKAKLSGKNTEATVKVSYETSSSAGQFKEVRRLAATTLDPMIADYKKMVAIQGESALKVKQELNAQKDKLNLLKQQSLTMSKNGQAINRNLQLRKEQTAEVKRLEGVLTRVSTLSSLKGQLREESQKLSMMSQYNVELNKQGQLVTVVNKKWAEQSKVVQGLSGQVNAAGNAAKGFGAKIQASGAAMQAAFGWISAVVAGLAAVAGAVGMITGRVKDIQAIKLTFDGLGQSIQAQNAILGSAKNIALSYGVSLRKIEGAFRRLGPAILESGGTLKDTEGAIKSLAARTTMLGLNTEQTGRYIEAFAQVMGKGKLQSEELNQQFSELDGGLRGQLKNWLAANKGITDFETAMKNGEITSGIFLEAFEAINEEIRTKFLRSIGDTQQAITKMGSEGGMTLNQLNAKLQTLTSIGLESVGKALAPLGKELMKIYAAFIQVFTKIATEMPGIQALFQGLGHVLGVIAKVAVNKLLLGFGMLMKAIDLAVQGLMKLYEALKNIPGLGGILKGLEQAGEALNNNFDKSIDIFSKLSDETTGAKAELAKYNDELKNLAEQQRTGAITQEEYAKKEAEIMARRTAALQAQAQKELDIENEKLGQMVEARNKQLERDEQLMNRKIETINSAKDQELAAIDSVIAGLERQKEATDRVYDAKIDSVKRSAEEVKNSIDKEISALNSQKESVKAFYSNRIEAVKDYYSKVKAEMDAAHSKEMAQIDAAIAKAKQRHSASLGSLDNGPQKQKLERMQIRELNKQIAAETDQYKKQELKAQLESILNSKEKAQLEKQYAEEMKKLEEDKAKKEKEQAEEKKRLDAEEKERVKELQEAQQQALEDIASAVQGLVDQKKEATQQEKEDIRAIQDAKKEAQNAYDDMIDEEKEKRKSVTKAALKQIDELKKAHKKEQQAVEDIEWEMRKMVDTQGDISAAADRTTKGALTRQLNKVKLIRQEMDKINAGGGGTGGNSGVRFAGGPVSGGSTYTVNELGTEGFLSASGRMSEIKAPAFGDWKAPSSGSVIPAHVWKGIKASQNTEINMPRSVSPGNAVARAISTINNSTGDHVQNSVTIQAINPTQAASDIMVQLAKIKRLRYN